MPFDLPASERRKLSTFRPKLRFQIDVGDLVIRTVESIEDLRKVLRLRYDCFVRERGLGTDPDGMECDAYELEADHVAVFDRRSDEALATYRMICSTFSARFFSQEAFNLADFLAAPGVKLELCRACVRADKRDGPMIGIVWRGIARYIQETGADFLFGRVSVNTTSAAVADRILHSLTPRHTSDRFRVPTMPEFASPGNEPATHDAGAPELPRLLQSYLLAGAKIYGRPALDRGGHCTDFLTIIAVPDFHARFRRRYLGERP